MNKQSKARDVTQLAEACTEIQVRSPALHEHGLVVLAYDPSTGKVEDNLGT